MHALLTDTICLSHNILDFGKNGLTLLEGVMFIRLRVCTEGAKIGRFLDKKVDRGQGVYNHGAKVT